VQKIFAEMLPTIFEIIILHQIGQIIIRLRIIKTHSQDERKMLHFASDFCEVAFLQITNQEICMLKLIILACMRRQEINTKQQV
jgi:hypothetical protein